MTDSLNKKQIIELLPHRDPMLLIDELINIKKLFSATAIVNVRKDSSFVQGHFPGKCPCTKKLSFLTLTIAVAENNFLILINSSIKSMGSRCGNNSII